MITSKTSEDKQELIDVLVKTTTFFVILAMIEERIKADGTIPTKST